MTAKKVFSIIFGVLMIMAGSYCLFTPAATGLDIGYIIGIAMIIDGIGRIVNWFSVRKTEKESGWVLCGAILSLIFGIILTISLASQLAVDMFIAYMAAFWILIIGIVRIVRALKLHKLRKNVKNNINENSEFGKSWWVYLILGILLTLYGIICLIFPLVSLAAIGVFIGIGIVIAGANMIYLGTSSLEL